MILYVNNDTIIFTEDKNQKNLSALFFVCIFLKASAKPPWQDSLLTLPNSSYSSEYCHLRI